MRLSPEAASAGYRLRILGTTRSTNDDVLAAARAGDPGRLWIVAQAQEAGRGRHGRTWSSPPGNLYASLLLRNVCPPAVAPRLGFVAGIAAHAAVAAVTGLAPPRLALKWPNDLLLDGAKTAGLLLEAHRLDGETAVVVGFGVNVAQAPADTPYPATSLASVVPAAEPAAVFAALSAAVAAELVAFGDGGDAAFTGIRARWLARASGLGTPVRLRLPSGERDGTFEGIDRAGRLCLRTAQGLEFIDAGDLTIPTAKAGSPVPDRRAAETT